MSVDGPIIVTGVSSFVGAHLSRYLAEKGLNVIATHSSPRRSYTGIEAERLAFTEQGGAIMALLDLSDGPGTAALIEQVRPAYWISHTGWTRNYAAASYDFVRGQELTLGPYDEIFRALRTVGCRGVISTGSSAEYSYDMPECQEDDRSWPTQPYGLTKLCKTIRFRQLAELYRVPVRIARLFIPFGVLDAPEKLMAAAAAALLDGRPIDISSPSVARDFIGVRDVCRGYLTLLHDCARPPVFDVFNLSRGEPSALEVVLRQLADALGTDPALLRFGQREDRAGEPASFAGNCEKARALLGWQPEPLADSLRDYALALHEARAQPTAASPSLIRLSRSSVNSADIGRVSGVLRRAFLGMGEEVDAFEHELAAYLGGGREVVCVSTGTAALHLALQACGVGPGDEVLVPTITYVASFQAISATGATPVACDVRESDCYLDVADAARRLTPRTKAIMPVHYASGLGAIDEVYAFAKTHGLRVIEDAAHAFGCTYRGARVGAFGDVVCFSFDGIKNITCGEGGALVTGDKVVAERARTARLLGVEKDTEHRYAGLRSWEFDVLTQGWRYHMSNPNAALGRAQLQRLDRDFAPRRSALAQRYRELLAGVPAVRCFDFAADSLVPHIFPIRIRGGARDTARAALRARNIESGIHYMPNHLLTCYGGGATRLPVAEQLFTELATLPLHYELTDHQQLRVVDVLRAALPG